MTLTRGAMAGLGAITALVFLLLYGPLLVPIVSSLFTLDHGSILWDQPSLESYAALSRNETEVTLWAMHAQLLHDLESQLLDAAAHGIELLRPLPPRRLIAQDRVDDGRAVIGRHRPDATREAHQMAERGIRRRGR